MLPQRVVQVALLLRVEGGVGLCLVGVAVGALVDAPAGLFSAPRLLQPSSTLFAITFIKGAEGPHNNVWGNGKMESHVTTDSMADRPTGRQFGVHAPSIFRPQYSSSMLWPDQRRTWCTDGSFRKISGLLRLGNKDISTVVCNSRCCRHFH